MSGAHAGITALLEMGASVGAENHAGKTAYANTSTWSERNQLGEVICTQLMTTCVERKEYFETKLQVEASRECGEANVRLLVAAGVNLDALAVSATIGENRKLRPVSPPKCYSSLFDSLFDFDSESDDSDDSDYFIANVDKVDNDDDAFSGSALHFAAQKDLPGMCRLLVELNATVDLPSNGGDTPLILAVRLCNSAAVEILLELGANTAAENNGETAYAQISEHERNILGENICHRLITTRSQRDDFNAKYLGIAVNDENKAKIKSLVTAGAKLSADHLLVAAARDRPNICRLLVELNAAVDQPWPGRGCGHVYGSFSANDGDTPLMVAVGGGNRAAVLALLDMGASTTTKNHAGETAFAMAIADQEFYSRRLIALGKETCLRLMSTGAQRVDFFKRYLPVMISTCEDELRTAAKGHKTTLDSCPILAIRSLVAAGANVDAQAEFTDTCPNCHTVVPTNAGKFVNHRHHTGYDDRSYVCHQCLLKGAALHNAAGSNLPNICQVLVDLNATLDIRNRNGDTPLIWAVRESSWGAVDMLLNAGASTIVTNKQGKTAFNFLGSRGTSFSPYRDTEKAPEVLKARIDPETWRFHDISQLRSIKRWGYDGTHGIRCLAYRGGGGFLRLPLLPSKRPSADHAVLKLHSKDAISTVLFVGAKTYCRPWGELPEIPNEIILLILEFVLVTDLGLSVGEVKKRDRLRAQIRSEKNESNLETLNAMLADAVAKVSSYEEQLSALIATVQRDLTNLQERVGKAQWPTVEEQVTPKVPLRCSKVTIMMLHPQQYKEEMITAGRHMGEAVYRFFKHLLKVDLGNAGVRAVSITSLVSLIQVLCSANKTIVGWRLADAGKIRKIHQQYLASKGKLL
jgi:ankyrin repeat protein